MSGRRPEDTVRVPASRQEWSAMTFLHWPVEPGAVQAHLPEGLEPDTWEGSSWVSLTPFLMVDFRLATLPPLGRLSTFPETNLRTYARDRTGRDGLWFLSLEADSLPTVLAASTVYGVPYRYAEMSVEREDTVRYRSRRRDDPGVGHDIEVRPGAARPSSPFEDWLTGRWRAYTTVAGRLAVASVQHEPWPLHDVEVLRLEESLLASVGLPAPDREPLAQYSPGVSVKRGPPLPA